MKVKLPLYFVEKLLGDAELLGLLKMEGVYL